MDMNQQKMMAQALRQPQGMAPAGPAMPGGSQLGGMGIQMPTAQGPAVPFNPAMQAYAAANGRPMGGTPMPTGFGGSPMGSGGGQMPMLQPPSITSGGGVGMNLPFDPNGGMQFGQPPSAPSVPGPAQQPGRMMPRQPLRNRGY